MLDLCSGLGGASAAMRAHGWQVVAVDYNPSFRPDVIADIRDWIWDGDRPDLIWLSDPCTEFSRESMPWHRTGRPPDLSILRAGLQIIAHAQPRFWIRENVRGAVRWSLPLLGRPRWVRSPLFLWGYFPDIGRPHWQGRNKESYSSAAADRRAEIPAAVSHAVAVAIERQATMDEALKEVAG